MFYIDEKGLAHDNDYRRILLLVLVEKTLVHDEKSVTQKGLIEKLFRLEAGQ